jgi:hypothetical protein
MGLRFADVRQRATLGDANVIDTTLTHPATVPATRTALATSVTPAVSWAAVVAGAIGAAALSLILLVLGTGLGLSSVSPWAGQGAAASTLGLSAIVWLSFTQIAAAGMGGYLAGRLRTRWTDTSGDEVYFRDTAHGFLAWALATLITAGLLTSAIGAVVGGSAQAGASVAAGAASSAATALPSLAGSGGPGYFVDALFRKQAALGGDTGGDTGGAPVAPTDDSPRTTAEVARIFTTALANGTLAEDDARYVGQLVAQRTGVAPADAQKKVVDTFSRMQTQAKQAADTAREAAETARKASAYSALWLFISLLIGAFCASLAATFGGRLRDRL